MIELSHVSKNFGTFRAVNDINFSIPTGEIVGLLGPNGAGKTTTMRMITGFYAPSSGSIKIDGIDATTNSIEAKKKIGYMPESAPLYSDMIVEDYLRYIAEMQGEDPEVKVPALCAECGLKQVMNKNISELSRGNRQRVALAHALMHDPEILILDEPTSGLDPNQVEDVRKIIKEIGKTRTVIISTHILSEVEMLCKRVIIISGGKLVADSPTDELRARFGNSMNVKITATAPEADLVQKFQAVENVNGVKPTASDVPGASSVLISVNGEVEIRPALFEILKENNWTLYEMSVQKNSLEDVFHVLTGSDNAPNDTTVTSENAATSEAK